MYVRDLEPGILIRPDENYEWDIHPIERPTITMQHKRKPGYKELLENGIAHHVTCAYRYHRSGWSRPPTNDQPAVYVGVKQIKEHYYGVKKQHVLLIGNVLAVMEGYQFKEVEKV